MNLHVCIPGVWRSKTKFIQGGLPEVRGTVNTVSTSLLLRITPKDNYKVPASETCRPTDKRSTKRLSFFPILFVSCVSSSKLWCPSGVDVIFVKSQRFDQMVVSSVVVFVEVLWKSHKLKESVRSIGLPRLHI